MQMHSVVDNSMAGLVGHTCFGLPAATALLLLGASLLSPALAEPDPEPEATPDADAHRYGGHHYNGYGVGYGGYSGHGGYGGYGGGYGYGKRAAEPDADPEAFHHHFRRPYGYYQSGNYKRSAEPGAEADVS